MENAPPKKRITQISIRNAPEFLCGSDAARIESIRCSIFGDGDYIFRDMDTYNKWVDTLDEYPRMGTMTIIERLKK